MDLFIIWKRLGFGFVISFRDNLRNYKRLIITVGRAKQGLAEI